MKRTPTGSMAILVSWVVIFSGISLAVFSYSAKSWGILSIILATSFAVSIILRLLANMNEFLFNLNSNIYSLVNKIDEENRMFREMSTVLQESNQTLQGVNKGVQESNQTLQGVNKGVQESNQTLQRVNKGVQESDQTLQGIDTAAQEISQEGQSINAIAQEINSDSKSISNEVCKLTSFFEEIERHLDLKK